MLEHLVLSGSYKYPYRDLFSAIRKRSFTTFMNASTSKLFTSFPFSTINVQDFFNVLDVYLDSLFHPILSPIEFMSECFHVEFENNDPNKHLINTGVVYNEMLGTFNSAYHRIYNKIVENLFNESPERFISGGIPECICKRTIEDIRRHHLKYYHPSNSFFYLYGNVSIEKVLSKVDGYISEFSMGNWKFSTSIFNQKRWKEPRRIEIEDAFDPMIKDKKKQFRVIVSYMTNPWNDLASYYNLNILVFYLLNEENSPFYKAIIKSGLALKFFAEGLHSESYNTFVSFGFEGLDEFDVDKVIQTIDETLLKCYNEGFSSERFEGIIHMFELYYHELKSDMGMAYY